MAAIMHLRGLRPENGYWILPLAGRRVTRCLIDFGFTLEFFAAGNKLASIRIETAFNLVRESTETTLDPQITDDLGSALVLFQQEVRTAIAAPDGSLEVTFSNGAIVRVPKNASYEAWQVSLDDGSLLVSQPGGSLTFFRGPETPEQRDPAG
jgi:hypothetical protein